MRTVGILLLMCSAAFGQTMSEEAFKAFWEGEFADYKAQFEQHKASWNTQDARLRAAAAAGDRVTVEDAFAKMKQIRLDGEVVRVAQWNAEELAERQAKQIYGKALHEILEVGTPAYLDWVWLLFFVPQTGVSDGSGQDIASVSGSVAFEFLPIFVQGSVAVAGCPLAMGLTASAGSLVNIYDAHAQRDAILADWNRIFRGAEYDTTTLRSAVNLQQKHQELQDAIETHRMRVEAYPGKAKDIALLEYLDGQVQEMQAYWDHVRHGDRNEDGKVDQADADGMQWGPHPHVGKVSWARGDFNQDGNVDFTDFLILSDNTD